MQRASETQDRSETMLGMDDEEYKRVCQADCTDHMTCGVLHTGDVPIKLTDVLRMEKQGKFYVAQLYS
jgi:hypothetical protein